MFVGELEWLAGIIFAHVNAQANYGRNAHLNAGAIIDSELSFLVAVVNRGSRGEEAGELHTARHEGPYAGSFRSGVEKKIVEALLDGHGDTATRTQLYAAAVVSVAELMAGEAIGVQGKPEGEPKAVIDGVIDGVAACIGTGSQIGVAKTGDSTA